MTDEQLLRNISQIVASQLAPIDATLQEHGKDLKTLKAWIKKIDKTQDIVIRMFDERIASNTREIERIKEHIGLSSKH